MRSLDRLLARYPVSTAEVWRTTVNLARIETTNSAVNQIPADAQAWLDIRFPAEDPDLNGRSTDEIAEYLACFCGPGVTVEVIRLGVPHWVDQQSPEVRLLQHAARNQGYPADILRRYGAADSRFFSQRGMDAVIFGIGGEDQHGPQEYADTTTITPYYRTLTTFLTALDSTLPAHGPGG
jgi:succinyl-diaminopimelate desuccinylase